MFIILDSNRVTGKLSVTNTDNDEITEITAKEYWEADKNLGLAVKHAKDRMARELGPKVHPECPRPFGHGDTNR